MWEVKSLKDIQEMVIPRYENELGERLCCLDGCYAKSYNHPLCSKHVYDDNDYSEYLKSISKPFNTYKIIDNYCEVTVNNSDLLYKMDIEDIIFAKKYTWSSEGRIGDYPYLTAKVKNKRIKFHIEIMNDEIDKFKNKNNYNKRVIVDHKNGDVTDNRKSNLRIRTQSENNMNKTIQSNNSSGVVGVSWHNRDKIWESKISIDDKEIYLGRFYYLRNAVKARIEAEDTYFGEHAFKERDDNTYRIYIENILSLPEITEPRIRERPNNEFGMIGVKRDNKSKKGGYIAYINISKNVTKQKKFIYLEDAIRWRKEKEIELYGCNILYKDEKEEKLI